MKTFSLLLFSLLFFTACTMSVVNEAEQMEQVWQTAREHHRNGTSMSEDTLLPRTIRYFRDKQDTARLLESYLLEAAYEKWLERIERMTEALNHGLQLARELRDTAQCMTFHYAKSEALYKQHNYQEAAAELKEILQFKEKLSARMLSHTYYQLALNLSMVNDPTQHSYFKQSIDLAMAMQDTATAVHYMRNYADALAGPGIGRYAESNALLQHILRISPQFNQYSILHISLANNFLNLHQPDSARHHLQTAQVNEGMLQSQGHGDNARSACLLVLQNLMNYIDHKPVNSHTIGRFCDSITLELTAKQNTITQQLKTKNRLQQANYELRLEQQRTFIYLIIGIVLLSAAALLIRLRVRSRYRRLAEAEERIDTLTRLLEEVQQKSDESSQAPSTSSTTDDAFFKKLLLQQLGIIRLVATTPTTQNQELLRRISGISNNEIPVDNLIHWNDLYPIIDRLYNNFYTHLIERFGTRFTDKEIQICCLLCASFSTKEIGVITQQTSATIYVRKTSIRKKIGAGEKEDIVECLSNLDRLAPH